MTLFYGCQHITENHNKTLWLPNLDATGTLVDPRTLGGLGMFGGPGTLTGSETPGGSQKFGIPRTCGSEKAQGTMRAWEPFRGPRIPGGPTSPYFLYFLKYNCQPTASSALLHFPGSLPESPWDPLGQSYDGAEIWPGPDHQPAKAMTGIQPSHGHIPLS
jgi:hypothetical protein